MKKVREMNERIFRANLLEAISEIIDMDELNTSDLKFKIELVKRKNNKPDMYGDVMRLVLLSEKNIGNKLLTLNDVVSLMTSISPFVPSWVHVSFLEKVNNIYVFKLETAGKVTKPSLLKYAETGHAPFKAIYK